jgi:aerobic-type carbon monoxide dehydrogenase small subunit (CoxS/CutS family)
MIERVSMWVNGDRVERDVEPRRLLSDFLRHDLRLVGTHVGCEQGVCGACTVLVGGEPVRSCLTFAVQCQGQQITTVEGLAPDGELSPLQAAFSEHGALQCGFCTAGFLTTLTALLDSDEELTEERLVEEVSANICRCTGYHGILDAVRSVVGDRLVGSATEVEVRR